MYHTIVFFVDLISMIHVFWIVFQTLNYLKLVYCGTNRVLFCVCNTNKPVAFNVQSFFSPPPVYDRLCIIAWFELVQFSEASIPFNSPMRISYVWDFPWLGHVGHHCIPSEHASRRDTNPPRPRLAAIPPASRYESPGSSPRDSRCFPIPYGKQNWHPPCNILDKAVRRWFMLKKN